MKHVCVAKMYLLAFVAALALSGCVRNCVRVDLDNFPKNPQEYKDKDVIVTAALSDVLSRYPLYLNKQVEITAPCSYYGYRSFWTWYLMIDSEGKKLRCYTHHYRNKVDNMAVNILLEAKKKHEPITVEGVLRKDGLDLEKIMYNDRLVRTNFRTVYLYPYYGWW